MRALVLDASVAMPWFFEDEQDPLSEAVLDGVANGTLTMLSPSLWLIEVTNALIVAERRDRITAGKVDRAVTQIKQLPLTIDASRPSPEHLIRLCRKHQRSAYDAVYLDLAIRDHLPLATLDNGLRQACIEAGVNLYVG